MKTLIRYCIKNHTITDQQGNSFTVKSDREYTTSDVDENNTVVVFSDYWVRVPIEIFGHSRIFTND
jgi:hypothetical protein